MYQCYTLSLVPLTLGWSSCPRLSTLPNTTFKRFHYFINSLKLQSVKQHQQTTNSKKHQHSGIETPPYLSFIYPVFSFIITKTAKILSKHCHKLARLPKHCQNWEHAQVEKHHHTSTSIWSFISLRPLTTITTSAIQNISYHFLHCTFYHSLLAITATTMNTQVGTSPLYIYLVLPFVTPSTIYYILYHFSSYITPSTIP